MTEEFYRDSRPDMVILPGGMPGTLNLGASQNVRAAVEAAAAHGGTLAAICAAPSILGKMGLLRGKKATCFPGFEKDLAGAECLPDKVVTDGNIITSRGMGTALEFGLALVAHLCGPEKAETLRKNVQV